MCGVWRVSPSYLKGGTPSSSSSECGLNVACSADALDELFDRGMTKAALMGTSNRRKLMAFVTGEPYVRKPEDSESEPEPDLDEEEGGAESDSDHFWEVSDD